jgi:ATP-dependent helicase HrpA
MLEDKITALIKTLPKGLRRHFVPAPEFARACAESLRPGGQPLLEALSQRLRELTGVEVPVQAWREPDLPPHLRMNIRLLDPRGGVLAEGRDLQELRDGFGEVAASSFESALPEHYRREGITNWDFGDLPESISVSQGPVELTLYPSLLDRGQNVALTLLDTPQRAAHELRGGVLRLLLLRLGKDARRRLRDHPDMAAMGLRYAAVDTSAALQQDLLLRTAAQVFLPDRPLPRTREAFQAMLDAGRGNFADRLGRNVALMDRILAAYHPIAAALKETAGLAGAHQDMREQLRYLVFPGFFRLLPDGALPRLPVYLEAMQSRLAKLRADPRRDRSRFAELMPFWQRCLSRLNSGEGVDEPAFQRYRWLLEEYRISLFAQHLRTSEPVSAKRLSEQWRRVEGAPQAD